VCKRRMYVCERARMNYVLYDSSYIEINLLTVAQIFLNVYPAGCTHKTEGMNGINNIFSAPFSSPLHEKRVQIIE